MNANQIDQVGDGSKLRYPCNDFELADLIGGVCIHPGSGSGAAAWRLQTPGGGDQKFSTFADAAAAGGGGDWFKVNGRLRGWSGAWFPAAAVERAKQIGAMWEPDRDGDKPKKVKFTGPGTGCEVTVNKGDSRWSSFTTCGRLVVGVTRQMGNEECPSCSLHVNGALKRAENDRLWREKWDADRLARERAKANRERCLEVLEAIRPLLAELGVHPDTLVVGEAGDRVGVLLPAEVAELLTAKAVELEEIKGGDW